ncbi:hypothetical protein BH09ACT1_BH09ACT1_21920 [soil metagenome]
MLDADGSVIATLSYMDDISATVASLDALLPEKATHLTIPAGLCNYEGDRYSWGDGLVVGTAPFHEPWTNVIVASGGPSVGGVSVGTPDGFGVGDPSSVLAAGISGATAEDWGDATLGGTLIWYDLDANDRGVFAMADKLHGSIVSIIAPQEQGSDC